MEKEISFLIQFLQDAHLIGLNSGNIVSFEAADLSSTDLSGANLSSVDLNYANLRSAMYTTVALLIPAIRSSENRKELHDQLLVDVTCLRRTKEPQEAHRAGEGQSGSRRASLLPSPLRTVRAPLNAHGSSTSRTALLLLLFVLCPSSGFAFCRQQVTVVNLLAVAQRPF